MNLIRILKTASPGSNIFNGNPLNNLGSIYAKSPFCSVCCSLCKRMQEQEGIVSHIRWHIIQYYIELYVKYMSLMY